MREAKEDWKGNFKELKIQQEEKFLSQKEAPHLTFFRFLGDESFNHQKEGSDLVSHWFFPFLLFFLFISAR